MGKGFFKKAGSLLRRLGYFRIFTYVFLIIISYVFIFPFLYMIVTSVKSVSDLYDISVNWIPTTLQWQNYKVAFQNLDYLPHLLNSILITTVCTAGHILSCSFVGYGFARFEFPLKKLWFVIVVLAIIIPPQVIILPLYLTYSSMGWLNTYLPLMVPTFFGFGLRGGLFIFIFRQFFLGLPPDLENAAKIDGCGFLGAYFRIAFPVSRSSSLLALVLSLVWHWNDFYEPVIYLGKPKNWPLPSMLPSIYEKYQQAAAELTQNADTVITEGVVMAATFLVIVPVLIAYCFLQKQFVQGVERSGLVE